MLSLESIKRQVDREGARWGIFGVIRDGKCFAASNGKTSESHGGVGCVSADPVLICEVSEASPFALVLAHRVKRGEWDVMQRFRASEARRQKAMAAQYDEYAAPFRERARRVIDRPIRVSMSR